MDDIKFVHSWYGLRTPVIKLQSSKFRPAAFLVCVSGAFVFAVSSVDADLSDPFLWGMILVNMVQIISWLRVGFIAGDVVKGHDPKVEYFWIEFSTSWVQFHQIPRPPISR